MLNTECMTNATLSLKQMSCAFSTIFAQSPATTVPYDIMTSSCQHPDCSESLSHVAENFWMSRISELGSPALLPHSPVKNTFSIPVLWHWGKWSNSIVRAQVVSCSEGDPGLDWWGRNLAFGRSCGPDEAEQSPLW